MRTFALDGFTLRCLILAGAVAALVLAWRLFRPSTAHVLCALPAAIIGAFGDYWIETLYFDAGIWEHVGGRAWLTWHHVPLEMPLAFIPAGMAGLWCLSLGSRLRTGLSPAAAAAAFYLLWCGCGTAADLANLASGVGMRSNHTLAELALPYVVPFWSLLSAVPFFFYWICLRIWVPSRSVLDLRAR